MEKFSEILDQVLPWVVLTILFVFTLTVISNLYGIYKARKVDPTLRLALNKGGKIVMGLMFLVYIFVIVGTIVMEVQILSSELDSAAKMHAAVNAPNALTIITFIVAGEFQDIFYIGDKNIFVGNRMYEIRRMRKMTFPKKHKMTFIYGQKEYSYSTRFIDMSMLKPKFMKMH